MSWLILLGLSIAPGAFLSVYIYIKDKYEKEPIRLLGLCFLLGALSIIPAIILESIGSHLGFGVSQSSVLTFLYAFVVVGLSEELCKFLVVYLLAYRNKHFNEPFDGIIYCVIVSMGFATLENIMYVFAGGYSVGLLRMFTAVPSHATDAVIMGYFMGRAKFSARSQYFLLLGLFGAMLFHGAYDYCLMEMNYPGIYTGAILSFFVALMLSSKAIKEHQDSSPFKNS